MHDLCAVCRAVANASTQCRPSIGCTAATDCDGVHNVCPGAVYKAAGEMCDDGCVRVCAFVH
jgi:hypothetical protein